MLVIKLSILFNLYSVLMNIKVKIKSILYSDLNRKIATDSFWILSGNIISKVALLIATIVMARYISKEEYGQFGLIKSTILMFALFAGLELGITSTKYIAQYVGKNNNKVERVIGLSNLFAITLSLLISLLVYIFSEEIAKQISAPNLSHEIKISSFILFFSSLNGIQTGILNGLQKFKVASINNLIAGVISSILLMISSIYGDLDSIVIAFGLNFVIIFVLNYISIKKYFYSDFKINIFSKNNFQEIDVLLQFSLPAILAGLIVSPVVWLCNYFLVNQQNGFVEMANFDIANQWRNTVLFVPSALAQIVLPLLTSSIGNKEAYSKMFYKNLKINFFVGFSFVIILVILTPVIVWFYGSKYENAAFPMIIMFITTGFISVNNVVGQAIASQGKMWLGLFVNIAWAIVLLLSAYLLIMKCHLGAIGISLAYLISYIFHTIVQFAYIKKFL